jgi:hypothetical protein
MVAVSAPEKENTKEREELLSFDDSFLESSFFLFGLAK